MPQEVAFKKIVPEGKALGYLDDRACFCVGPLPGEVARVEVTKVKAKFCEAVMREVVTASGHRHEAAEGHYLLCSPWQGVDYEYQLALKRGMLAETFGRPELGLEVLEVVGAPEVLGYRNKLKFALAADEGRRLSLALHERGKVDLLVAVPGCVLGSEVMNVAAGKLLERINTLNIAGYVESLMLRESKADGKLLGVVGLHQVAKRDWSRLVGQELAGVVVSRVRPGRRQEVVWSVGAVELREQVGGLRVAYGFDGFFQTNVAAFELALERIVAAVSEGARVVDLYGGVGVIGLAAAAKAREVVGVEIDAGAAERARENAGRNGMSNYTVVGVPAERMDAGVLKRAECVIVDPPRAGLDRRVVEMLLAAGTERIIYLSCNPVTQARDLMLLGRKYRFGGVTGFDFYPGTLHLESLVVLERVNG
jgi:23S rRNA (uracil1939-C5)-methyltransferase